MLGAPRKMMSYKWKSVKVIITFSFLHKLIKLHNLVKASHEHDLLLEILEYCVYQSKSSQCKQTHTKVKLNRQLSSH